MRTRNMRRWLQGSGVSLALMLVFTLSGLARASDQQEVAGKKAKKAQSMPASDKPKGVADQGLAEFVPRSGTFAQKVKRGWSGVLVCSKTIDGVDWQIVETEEIGATARNVRDGISASEFFPSQDPVLQVVSFDVFSRFNAIRKGTAVIRYLGRAESGNRHCELRIEVEADTSELDSALKETIPSAQIKVIEVKSAAILQGTVPTQEDLLLATTVAQQFYPQIIPQLKVAAVPPDHKTPKGDPSKDPAQPTPAKPKPETPRQVRLDTQADLNALREEVQALRQDIRQLNELLAKRLESKDRAEFDPSLKTETSDDNASLRDGLLCFDAKWCGPCAQMRPIIQKLKANGSPIQVVDVDTHPELCKQRNVSSIPCFILLKQGKEVERLNGVTTEKNLKTLLKRLDNPEDSSASSNSASPDKSDPARLHDDHLQNVDLTFSDFIINYPVADLVYPLPPETKPKLSDWFRLIELIMTDVEPTCWVSNGGTCTIKANESSNSLVVQAPQAIQERVYTVFERERRKLDLQVSFAVTLIAAPDKPLAELIGADLKTDPDTGCILLDPAKTNLSIQAFQAAGGRIEFAPKLTIFNGQTAFLGSKSWPVQNETSIDFSLQMRGFIAPDRRSVGVNLALNPHKVVDELTRRTINVADGSSLLIDMTEELRTKNPEAVISGRAYLLLQPRIIVQEEEKMRLDSPFSSEK
ncbi:MAG: Thioredoxin protein [Schlesneria sp.]|nr:Thioredoxin protein [Schlesneria sp.]